MNDEVQLLPVGMIIVEEWQRTPAVRPNVTIDEWIVMPDHFHGIIAIHRDDADGTDASSPPPASVLRAGSLGAIIGQWKSVSTKRIRADACADFAWQTRFYDVIIRDAEMLERIRRYIAENPRRWATHQRQSAGVWM